MYSGFPEAFAVPGEMSSRGQHFYAEAEKLWKAGKGKATLPNVQGVIMMVLVYATHAIDNRFICLIS